MGFIDDLRPASFRGVAFSVDGDESTFGHRNARHEYPGRDGVSHEHLGRAAQGFLVTAIIIGAGFVANAAALEQALQQPGPGQLIHPHYGERSVVVLDVRRQHSTAAVGEVRFQITFEETTDAQYPLKSTDTAAVLGLSADNLLAAIEGDFTAAFNGLDIPDFLTADALARANDFTTRLQGLLSQGGVLSLLGGSLPAWTSVAEGFAVNVLSLFRQIAGFARPQPRPVIGGASASPATAGQVKGIMTALLEASGLSIAAKSPATSRTAATRVRNAQALDGLFRGASIAALGAAARFAAYESREEALAFRGLAAERLSALRDDYGAAEWDASWRACGQQLAAISRDVNERIGRLPRTLTVAPQAVRPSLALAHRLYGDDPANVFSRAEDIVARNRVRHPGFVPARELEVLIDAE